MNRSAKLVASATIAAALLSGAAVACFSEHVASPTSSIDAAAICANPASAGTKVVITRNFLFEPATITVAPGEQVLWVNCESTAGLAHTATADAGDWDSGLIPPLESYTRTFPDAGTFDYHCELHPGMVAKVVVE